MAWATILLLLRLEGGSLVTWFSVGVVVQDVVHRENRSKRWFKREKSGDSRSKHSERSSAISFIYPIVRGVGLGVHAGSFRE